MKKFYYSLKKALQDSTFKQAMTVVFGGSGLALLSSFFALGALASDSGFSQLDAFFFSIICYALPGQLVATELYANQASIAVIALTVLLVNCRLLPMTVSLLPLLNNPDNTNNNGYKQYLNFFLSHLVAVTSWVCYLGTYHHISKALRRRYFIMISASLWINGAIATSIGYFVGTSLPHHWLVGILFLNPIYFLCLMLRSLFYRRDCMAFFLGMLLLPIIHYFLPEWDIILAGVIAGSVIFYLEKKKTS